MAANTEFFVYIYPIGEIAVDSGDHTTYTLHGIDGQEAHTTPVVCVDGVEEPAADYTWSDGDATTRCSIIFDSAQAESAVITVDYEWKLTPYLGEEPIAYELDREMLAEIRTDVNGRRFAVESYQRVAAYAILLKFAWIDQASWDEIRLLAEQKYYTFGVEWASTSPVIRIDNLFLLTWPKAVSVPGMVALWNVDLLAQQID